MAIDSDVLVIGGGIAGLMAGIAAAREGVRVTLVTDSESTLRQASGLIDLLGYTGLDDGPVVEPFVEMERLSATHPYRIVGQEAVIRGMSLFDDVVGDLYAGAETTRNALLPTAAGTVKPTARYQRTMGAGLVSLRMETVIVGFERLPDLDGPLVADWLTEADVPFAVRGETLSFPGAFRTDAKVTRYARALDYNESVSNGEGERPIRDALAATLAPVIGDAERIGLPAILGLDRPREIVASLESALGIDVFEIPTGPPSIPGMRLQGTLEDAYAAAGGRLHTGAPVVDFTAEDDRITSVTVDRNTSEIRYRADEYVLATGGLIGKGIGATRERVVEPVFGCHVPHPEERYDWLVDEVFGDHPFVQFGLTVDDSLRPLDASGGSEYVNLRAAGDVIGGADFPAEKSGAGISIATGVAAGQAAAGGA